MKTYPFVGGVLLSVFCAACTPLLTTTPTETDLVSAKSACLRGDDFGCSEIIFIVTRPYLADHPGGAIEASPWRDCGFSQDMGTRKRGCSVVRADLLRHDQQEQQEQELTTTTSTLATALIVGILSSLTYPKYAGRAYGVQQGINAGLSTWTSQPIPEPLYPPLPQPPAPVLCRWIGQYWTCQ